MTSIEKGIIGFIVVAVIGIVVGVKYIFDSIEEAGGIRAVIVYTGKEIKGIAKDIVEDDGQ